MASSVGALVDGWAYCWRDEGVLGVGAPLQCTGVVSVVALFLGNGFSLGIRPRVCLSQRSGLFQWFGGLGTASSFTATHLGAFPVYAYLIRDLVSLAAISVTLSDGLDLLVFIGFAHTG